jgi:hypothetical protein
MIMAAKEENGAHHRERAPEDGVGPRMGLVSPGDSEDDDNGGGGGDDDDDSADESTGPAPRLLQPDGTPARGARGARDSAGRGLPETAQYITWWNFNEDTRL